ncbi:hypothetical protein LOD99_8712 [Oopsacas minuta]|uniref:Fibronectin type-III domain-containing protein n=1 Tax=Oopsacas minuta TaxID=111878 RepID=A0AAV7JFI0_9METZ|nr:hypothetical protein LOD99_8712 [Oopsacas minuta]
MGALPLGCVSSVRILTIAPENLSPPSLESSSSTSVVIRWDTPLSPNGIIHTYFVERLLPPDAAIQIATLDANDTLMYIDSDENVLTPFLLVHYRVVAVNSAGSIASSYANITTLQTQPSSIEAPTLTLIQPTSIQIIWLEPAVPNGIISEYILKYEPTDLPNLIIIGLHPSLTGFTLHDLSPYQNYSISITACTFGGCTESDVVVIQTGQVLSSGFSEINVDIVSSTELVISWLEPTMPNGLIMYYTLFRREDGGDYVQIAQGLFLSYNDSSLLPFHEYQYSLDVTNGAGTITYGNTSQIRTLADTPLAGVTLNATTTTSSIILLQWMTPSIDVVRGEVVNFEVIGNQVGSGQFVMSFFNGTDNMFSVTGLNPSITYRFQVILFNGVGYATSNIAEATTLDGAPKGVFPPILTAISSTAIQVEWVEPEQPNGVIVSYNIILDGVSVYTDNFSGVFIAMGLMPYTVYSFELVACTRFECTPSDSYSIRTLQSPPTGFDSPNVSDVQHDSFLANWAAPTVTNGDITSYSLYLRYVIPCSQSTDQDTCDYVDCPLGQSSCGYQCYTASTHVCCEDTLYPQADNHACCGGTYIERVSVSDVCCGGSFYDVQSDYGCCGGVYQFIGPGDICCDDGNTVNVGSGDACCGTTPYTDNDNFMCCGGNVVSQHINTMCCGETVVSNVDTVCCNGVTYSSRDGYVCCDTSYELDNVTLCCAASNGVERVISYASPANKSYADEKCCDVTAIPSQLSCCNNRGYNSQLETCSDRSTSTGANCGTGVTCPNAQSSTAYCNRCDFPFSTHTCDSIDLLNSNTQICYQTTAVFTGLNLSYRVTGLTPFTNYLAYVGVSNAAGETISPEISILTLEFTPTDINPPILTVLSATAIRIQLTAPTQPNGIIISYIVYRDGQEIATVNDSTQYTDMNLLPFTTFTYMISACTIIGCTRSDAVSTKTSESTPELLDIPFATLITPNSIELAWTNPLFPNGIIVNYTIYDSDGNTIFTGFALTTTITGLNAFTQYTYTLEACNSFGCVSSSPTTFSTSEIPPTTIDPPILTIIRFDELEISWSPPSSPNGIIQYYLLRKNDVIILNTTNFTYIDTDIFASTTYSYIIEAFNNVGSVISGAATVSTPDSTPSGLDPPILTAVNATAVFLEWIPPTLPNGVIIQYDLYQDNVNFVTLTDTTQLSFTRTGLIPFTQYSFRVSACTRSGCALSNAVLITTLEAPPIGIDPVFLLALSSSSIRVSWNPPAVLNGILIGYELLQTTANEPPLQIPVPPEINMIDIDNLNAFTLYTYTVKVRNSAGSVTSAEASESTLEALPMLFAASTVSSVTARSLILNWDEPAQPNGIILIYHIYARIITTPLNPIPMNRDPVLLLTVNGSTTSTQLQDLEPGSSYEFRIAANNSIGQVITTWVPATTAEDSPELLQLIMYTADPSGSSLDLSWNEPLKPNGVISEYLIYLGVNPIFRGVSNSFTYRLLTPFTDYELYLQACTSAGCTNGDLQVLTTAEIPPDNLNAPFLETLGSSSIRITWQLPLSPNGNIIRFLIHRMDPDNTLSQIHTVFNITLRNFIDTGLLPYSFYSYAITAENSVGFTQSDFISEQTDEGVPQGIAAPNVQAVLATEMRIQWTTPSSPNGVITNYDVIRDGNTIVSLSNAFVYFDTNLDPFTDYSYQITACNSRGGCVTSEITVEQTLESIPEGVIAPSLTAVSFSEVEVRWDPPTKPNGVIQSYMLSIDDVDQSNTITPFIHTQTNLSPYTIYRIAIIACTAIGCSVGPTSNILTLEYIPSGQPAPVVSVTSSKSTLVTWQVPSMPNGVIIGYDVIRNGSVVLFTNNTQNRQFADTNLRPAKTYVYSIRAYTSIGRSDPSQSTVITTSPDAPELLDAPTLTPLTSTSFKAEWSVPQIPNGLITRYDLLVENTVVFTGLQFEYIVTELQPFTMYNVMIRACTTTCTESQIATVVTSPDTPIGQPVPTLTALQGPAVLTQWEAPDMPNGIITEYRVFRREVFNVNGQTTFSDEILVAIVYNQLFIIDNSTDLKLYTDFQYKVVAINTVGQAVSEWETVRTVEGIPMDVVPPELLSSTHTSITLFILPPETTNGIITSYIVYRDDVQVAELTGTENTTTITNLLPYTIYYINVTACTVAGCATSEAAALSTGEYTPEGVSPPVADIISAREIVFTWVLPTKPNGILTSYSILAQSVCPQPTQPHINPGSCQYGTTTTFYTGAGDILSGTAQGLTPYATYQFFLVAANSHSAQQSPPSRFYTTDSAEPEVRDTLSVRRLCNTVTIDWSNVFHLNGLLKNFEFLVDRQVLDSTIATTKTVEDLIYSTSYEFKVKAVTSVGSVEQANFVLIETAPHCVDPSLTTPSLTLNVTTTPTTPVSVTSLVAIIIIIVVIIFLAVLFLCLFVFCIVILSSRKEREKYRTQSHTPLLAATNGRLDDPLSDLTLQESLMLENRSNTLDFSSRSKQASIANSSLSYGNSIRTPPSARYSPRLTQLNASKVMQSSDVDFSQDESGFRDTRL